MKELQTKKTITEAAIKNSRRKHQTEIGELMAKLEFLRDEDALLGEKMKEVDAEKGAMENKFKDGLRYCKSRSNYLRGSPSFLKSLPL
jgi:predicted nuclease with TOPRIM domain